MNKKHFQTHTNTHVGTPCQIEQQATASTLNPKFETLNPEPSTLDSEPSKLIPEPEGQDYESIIM